MEFSCCDAAPLHLKDLQIGMTRHPHPTSTRFRSVLPSSLDPTTLCYEMSPPPTPLPSLSPPLSLFTPRGGAPCSPTPPRRAAISVPLKPARRQREMRRRAQRVKDVRIGGWRGCRGSRRALDACSGRRSAESEAGEMRFSPSWRGRHCGGFIRRRQRDDIQPLL